MAEQESDVCEIVLEDPDRFVGPDGRTGNTDWAEHGVDVQGAPPVKISYHGFPLFTQKVAGEQIDKMLAHGVIEPSNSPWSFPRAAKWYGTSVFSTEFQVKIREYGNGADSTEIRNLGKKTSVVCIASELDAQLHLYHHLCVSQFK